MQSPEEFFEQYNTDILDLRPYNIILKNKKIDYVTLEDNDIYAWYNGQPHNPDAVLLRVEGYEEYKYLLLSIYQALENI